MLQSVRKIGSILLCLLVLVGATALARDIRYQGQDFEVFWHAGRAILSHRSVYAFGSTTGMMFKYPPWVATIFVPVALFPLWVAKWVWAAVNLLSLFAIFRWVLRQGCDEVAFGVAALAFWGIWAVHSMDGQIVIPILALVLPSGMRSDRPKWGAVTLLALGTKVFTVFSALGARGLWRGISGWLLAGFGALALSLPTLWAARVSPLALFDQWVSAASSGQGVFGAGKIFGRDNQGLVALAMRHPGSWLGVWHPELVAMGAICVVLAIFWGVCSRKLPAGERWAGWLALSCVIHPLSWFHGFVLAFPSAALALSRASASRNKTRIILGALGLVLITAVTRKTLGDLGARLELWSVKSWGVLLCLGVSAATHSSVLNSRKVLRQNPGAVPA